MKRLLIIIIAGLTHISWAIAGPNIRWNQAYQNYFNKYKNIAIREMQRYGIPASITLAQGVLESGAGNSRLATVANNHFGIKCHDWTGPSISHDDDEQGECFRVYGSAIESFEDHSKFLRGRRRYSSLFQLARTDYRGWAYGLKRAGYATNPAYANSLIDIIELYRLYEYDTMTLGKNDNIWSTPKPSRREDMDMRTRQFRAFNDNCYLTAHAGETYENIAREIGIKAHKLAKYNEQPEDTRLNEGEIVWLRKKKHHVPDNFNRQYHTAKSNESLYDIAQLYGVRLKNIIKANKKIAKRGLRTGDRVKLP
ncbi:glucosaminidase domain-containing protein [Prevotella nigrescens]|uniref:glucosaminidase domain-containing protein n=1 Tax=Prevotella nigrescens TaxID=28133 RepID=UPI0028DB683C|nr:glucosaminidase domain-containing protein [Prevotella nigrescens]